MGINRVAPSRALLALLLALSRVGMAQESQGAQGGAAGEDTYYYTLDEAGQAVFTQVLTWDGDKAASEYQVQVSDADGTILVDQRTTETSLAIHLQPGDYRYRIITYNALHKAETQSDWMEISVILAEQPTIEEVSPTSLYMDGLDERIRIRGSKLLAEARISLSDKDGKTYLARVVERRGEEELVVVFPYGAYEVGRKTISIVNPGGLASTKPEALRISFQRPLDILFSLKYAPPCPLQDQWVLDTWPEPIYPIDIGLGADVFFVKKRWGFIGLGLGCEWVRATGGEDSAKLTSDFLLVGVDALYKYRFQRRFHGVARLGGGLSLSNHVFTYGDFVGPSQASGDPYLRAGLSLQFFLPSKIYIEGGADYLALFLKDDLFGLLSPRLGIGYSLY